MSGKYSIDTIFRAIDRLSGPVRTMGNSVQRFTDRSAASMRQLDGAADKWLRGMANGATAVAAAGVAAGAGLAAAAGPGMEFDQQMANLAATSLKTRDEIADLEKEARRLGASTQYSATEVGGAMEAMAKAGFENQDVLAGVAGMIYAASAAGEELAATTETVSSVMKGMGLATAESTRVADVLALASVRTNSSIGSLGESMANVSSTARQLNVPLEDVVAMVALLQDVGLDASEAGSATATMLTMMAKPSDEVATKMKRMGISFRNAAGDMLAPAEVLGQLVKAGDQLGGNLNQVEFFADLFGMRGQKAAANLKDLFASGDVTKLVEQLKGAAGTAEKMAKLRMDTFGGDLDVLGESIKGIQLDLYDLSRGGLREIAKGMTKWVDANSALMVSGISDFATKLADSFDAWGARLGKILTVVTAAALGVKAWGLALKGVTAILAINPITAWVVGITAAVALIWAFWPEISEFFGMVWDGAKELGKNVWDAMAGMVAGVTSFFSDVLGTVKSFLVGALEFYVGIWTMAALVLYEKLEPAFSWIGEKAGEVAAWVMSVWAPIGDFFAGLWAGVVEVASFAWQGLVEAMGVAVETVKGVWGTLSEFFVGLWQGVASAFMTIVGPVLDTISGVIDGLGSVGAWMGGAAYDGVSASRDVGRSVLAGDRQMVSPGERVARSIEETTTTSKGELVIHDKTKRAELTKAPRGAVGIRLRPSGAL